MSFRASILRNSLPRQSLISRPLTTSSRPLTSSLRAIPSTYNKTLQHGLRRSLNTSQVANLEASRAVGDGGVEEAPHSGINVDKPTSMDS
ncbi:uncharacterized protein L201_004840 [Kwoniella dendrophila CBS 6074]|uniref:Uncharacterized protein n=1 Tax=Kwoniella dendrophila CBS 6074 TaxID=1295534 RepID=A0AAX4JWZ5_9TREE